MSTCIDVYGAQFSLIKTHFDMAIHLNLNRIIYLSINKNFFRFYILRFLHQTRIMHNIKFLFQIKIKSNFIYSNLYTYKDVAHDETFVFVRRKENKLNNLITYNRFLHKRYYCRHEVITQDKTTDYYGHER